METLDLSQLGLFMAAAEATSFSRAAQRAGVSKSSLSRGIARLESELGQQLFYRTTRRVTLTAAGAALYERAAPRLAELLQAMRTLPEHTKPPSGVLRLSAPNDLGVSVLAEIAARFCARFPEVRLDIELTSRPVDLVAERFDAALRATGRLEDSSLVARRLSPVTMGLFASPEYLARRGTPRRVNDLESHDIVQFRGAHGPIRLCRPAESERRARPARIQVDDFAFVREFLRADGGIGLLPSFLARDDLLSGTLVRVLRRSFSAQSALYFIHPAARHVPRPVTVFRDFVLELLSDRRLDLRE
jgi:DNA-binding transcriptional LysR family regulator